MLDWDFPGSLTQHDWDFPGQYQNMHPPIDAMHAVHWVLKMWALRGGWVPAGCQIQVQFGSYLERVAQRAEGPMGSASASCSAAARLESLRDALTQIDAHGARGAEAIDEAQVRLPGLAP